MSIFTSTGTHRRVHGSIPEDIPLTPEHTMPIPELVRLDSPPDLGPATAPVMRRPAPHPVRHPQTRGEALLVRPYMNPRPSPCREVVARERSVIADSMGTFTVDCYHCGAKHWNAQALTFPQLRRSAWDCGWRIDGYARWVCARDVRSNPLFTPLMQIAERITCRKCGEVIRIIDGDWTVADGTTRCLAGAEPYAHVSWSPHEPAMAETAVAA